MPRNGSGTYTLPQAPFVPSTTISSSAMNSDLSDIALALTGSVAADGQTPITGGFKFPDGSVGAPAISFVTDPTDGFYHPSAGVISVSLGGVASFTFQAPSVAVGGGITGPGGSVLDPFGVVADYAGGSVPAGWMLCYGQAISRTTYAGAWLALGSAWGSGNGSTTFNLPDLRGRVTFGKDSMGGSNANRLTSTLNYDGSTVGNVGGFQSRTTSSNEIPAHSHGGTTEFEGQTHTHGMGTFAQESGSLGVVSVGQPGKYAVNAAGSTGTQDTSHTHIFNTTTSAVGGLPYGYIPPSAITLKMIYVGV